ncbi:MAG: HAD-IIIA family hydrolase [Candidatus Marinimicrobia bacterium]|jgi:histidinol-phosphate phosphatase family protein|nr:HAD-IIIA family hydrolase [Candidatus Neomarinimicrobiota bacterium]MDD5060707.1 HAD-IIIA family hydrolase [Candidatus Neomarinimicrobiota bacterium]
MNRAVFLDRDGTLNYDSREYIRNLTEFRLFPTTVAALKKIQALGYKLIIITNQACVAKGLTTVAAVEEIHQFLKNTLKEKGVKLAAIYYCPHHPDDDCDCRKPKIGNVLRASREHEIDLSSSFFIGDSKRDVETGKTAGCRTILVRTGVRLNSQEEIRQWSVQPDFVTANLMAAVEFIEKFEGKSDL